MKRRIAAFVIVPLLFASILVVSNASAGEPVKFRFHIANAFIQTGTGLPQTGAQAQADNGDIARVFGRGSFNASTGRAGGGGSFAHTDADGNLIGFGRWTTTGVMDFEPFGCGVAGDGTELPPNFCGGVLTLAVRLSGVNVTAGAAGLDGVLTITCLVGDSVEDIPPEAEEGITLDLPGAINFDDLVPTDGGLTLFVARDL